MARGRASQTQNIRAKIKSGNAAGGPEQVKVQTPSSSSTNKLVSLQDIDATTLEDGALLQYDATTDKFVTRTTIDTTEGELVFNAGQF
tara:strand:+ start:1907 stop:2170 length:264 start_codon:yes stop_codon:yes gene_type:complete